MRLLGCAQRLRSSLGDDGGSLRLVRVNPSGDCFPPPSRERQLPVGTDYNEQGRVAKRNSLAGLTYIDQLRRRSYVIEEQLDFFRRSNLAKCGCPMLSSLVLFRMMQKSFHRPRFTAPPQIYPVLKG